MGVSGKGKFFSCQICHVHNGIDIYALCQHLSCYLERRAFAYAEIDGMLFHLLQNSDARAMLRVILINTYLSNQPTKTMPDIRTILAAFPLLALVA